MIFIYGVIAFIVFAVLFLSLLYLFGAIINRIIYGEWSWDMLDNISVGLVGLCIAGLAVIAIIIIGALGVEVTKYLTL